MSQVYFSLFSLFLPVNSFRSSRATSVAILPSALLVERFSLGAGVCEIPASTAVPAEFICK